ncbi:MAG: glycosyltransferase family 39 protein [Ignavibacteria bacterium]|jgi:hypothetical protein|nr:glycosyltransferase family 39 protein [Ignavibacteria bacterium]
MKQQRQAKNKKSKSTEANTNWYESKKLFWLGLAIIALTYIIVYPQIFDPKVADLEDNTYYYLLGHSLADGNGYTDEDGGLHLAKSPMVPIINSVIITLGGDIVAIKMANGIMFFLSLVMLYYLLFKISSNVLLAFVTVLLIQLNTNFLFMSTIIMSEMPYLFFLMASLFMFYAIMNYNNLTTTKYYLLLIGTSLSVVAAYNTRPFGAIWLIAMVLVLLFAYVYNHKLLKSKYNAPYSSKKYRSIVSILILSAIFLISIFVWKSYTDSYQTIERPEYIFNDNFTNNFLVDAETGKPTSFSDFGYWSNRFTYNASQYTFKIVPNSMFWNHIDTFKPATDHQLAFGLRELGLREKDANPTLPQILLGNIVLIIILLGAIQYRKNIFVWSIFLFIIGSFIILYTNQIVFITDGFRYMQALTPFLLFFFLTGLVKSAQWLVGKFSKSSGLQNAIAPLVIAIFLAIVMPHYILALQIEMENAAIRHPDPNSDVDFNAPYHKQFLDYLSACNWIKHNVPDSAIIGFRKPKIYMIYTGSFKKGIYMTMPAFDSNPEEVLEYLDKWKVQYLLLDTWYAHAFHTIVPAIQQYPEKFNILQQIGGDIPNGINPTYIVEYNKNGFVETENK